MKKTITKVAILTCVLFLCVGCETKSRTITDEELVDAGLSDAAHPAFTKEDYAEKEKSEHHWDALDDIKNADLLSKKMQIDDKVYRIGMSFDDFYKNITSSEAEYTCKVASNRYKIHDANTDLSDGMLVPSQTAAVVFFQPNWTDFNYPYGIAVFSNMEYETKKINDLKINLLGVGSQAESNTYYGGGVRADGKEGIDVDGLTFVNNLEEELNYNKREKSLNDGRILYAFSPEILSGDTFTGSVILDQATGDILDIRLWYTLDLDNEEIDGYSYNE